MSPKPIDPPVKPPKPKPVLEPRAFRMIPDGMKKMTMAERRGHSKKRRDEMIAKFGHPKDKKNGR